MVYIFRNQSSTGARDLAAALGGSRLRNFENGRFFKRMRSGRLVNVPLTRSDHIVCWGSHVGTGQLMASILNNTPLKNKFQELEILRRAGVPTVEFSRTLPVTPVQPVQRDPAMQVWQDSQELVEAFSGLTFSRGRPVLDGLDELTRKLGELAAGLRRPAPTPAPLPDLRDWVGRSNNHTGGSDLLTPPPQPDYFVKKIELVEEFRVHSFMGKSIRAGKKVPREGVAQHPWVRSWDGGWRISYDGVSSKKKHRELAHTAVAALGLQFGAVDIGQKRDGTFVVLEVNRSPGLEGGTVTAYADAVRQWIHGGWQAEGQRVR